jgi:peptidoglycan/LPS O-acetylase OafA/YrhL
MRIDKLGVLTPLQHAATDLWIRPKNNISSLDFLRSCAILLVLSAHVGGLFPSSSLVNKIPFVSSGWTGVDLFFVLSGYLIGRQLWKELTEGQIHVGRFILRRGFRIWPLYFSFVITLCIARLIFHQKVSGIWADFLCVSNYFHHQLDGGWSLSTEEQFYIIAPVTLYLGSYLWSKRKLVWFPITWLIVSPVVRWTIIGTASGALVFDKIYEPMITHSDGLAVGVIIAWVRVYRPGWLGKAKLRVGVAIVFAGLLIFGTLYAFDSGIFAFSAWSIFYGAVTIAMLRGLEFRITAWKGFYILSRLSYGIYLNHQYVLSVLIPHLQSKYGAGYFVFVAGWLAGLTISLLISFITFSLIELPFLRLRERWIEKTRIQYA